MKTFPGELVKEMARGFRRQVGRAAAELPRSVQQAAGEGDLWLATNLMPAGRLMSSRLAG